MIDEETFANLLAEHATRIPVPDAGIDALLSQSPERERVPLVRRLPRPSARVLAGAAALCLVAGGCIAFVHSGGSGSESGAAKSSGGANGSAVTAPPTSVGVATGLSSNTQDAVGLPPLAANSGGTAAYRGAVPGGKASSTAPTSGAVTAPTDTARVIRTATVDLRIARHTFGTVVARVTTTAASEGGFISNADTNEAAATPSGSMTVRVPSARFNETVGKLRALGRVESQTTRGTDVTGQYTDLHARLTAATATRDAYLAILQHATNIGDVLAVQDRIEGVQTQIDQLQGQINSLDNQTTFATITLSVSEPPPKVKHHAIVKPHKKSGLEVAWDNARDGFSRRIEGLISHSGSAAVILLSLLALAYALRLLIPRARRLFV